MEFSIPERSSTPRTFAKKLLFAVRDRIERRLDTSLTERADSLIQHNVAGLIGSPE